MEAAGLLEGSYGLGNLLPTESAARNPFSCASLSDLRKFRAAHKDELKHWNYALVGRNMVPFDYGVLTFAKRSPGRQHVCHPSTCGCTGDCTIGQVRRSSPRMFHIPYHEESMLMRRLSGMVPPIQSSTQQLFVCDLVLIEREENDAQWAAERRTCARRDVKMQE